MHDHLGEKPAPGGLRIVQAFINTGDPEGHEELTAPEQLRDWLRDHNLLSESVPVGDGALRQAIEVREALRDAVSANNGGAFGSDALETLNRMGRSAQMTLVFHVDARATLEPRAPGLDGALGSLLAAVFSSMADGSWRRLKACAQATCRFAFYDQSKNHSGTWCTMAVCGNRTKARAFRGRGASPKKGVAST